MRAFAGCGKCELDKSEFSAASPHTKEQNSLLISLFQTHTGGLSAAKKKSRRATGMFFYFYFLCTARCSRYWRFSSSFFSLFHTKRCGSVFFLSPSSINCQLSSITPASLTDQMKLLEARGKLISVSRPRTPAPPPPRCQWLLIN